MSVSSTGYPEAPQDTQQLQKLLIAFVRSSHATETTDTQQVHRHPNTKQTDFFLYERLKIEADCLTLLTQLSLSHAIRALTCCWNVEGNWRILRKSTHVENMKYPLENDSDQVSDSGNGTPS